MPLKIDHLTVVWRDRSVSEPYYGALLPLLGFRKTESGNWTDDEGMWFQFRDARPDTTDYERYGPGVNHVGFTAPSPEAVEHVQAVMRAAGFEAPEIQTFGEAKALFMKDPDGLRFEVSWYPPGVAPVE